METSSEKPKNLPQIILAISIVIVLALIVVFLVLPALASSSPRVNTICDSDFYNCDDFSTQAEAKAVYNACFSVSGDIHGLDNNDDGDVCESLPSN
ncbi:MAG: hypothetical protein Q8Q04_03495 [archaeon]|nr:hypothetical protein [archaeon]